MAMCRRVSVLIGRKDKIKGIEGSSKGDLKKIHATKVQHPTILSKSRHLKPDATHDVTTWDTQMNSRCNLKVTSLESPVKTEVEEAYEGEDEHEDLTSIKRELSDFDLQVHEAVASKRGYDPTGNEMNSPSLYKNQANIQLEDRDDKYHKKSVDLILSGHV